MSAPGLFSTRTESVCLTDRDHGFLVRELDEIERGGSRGNHRVAVLARVDPRIDDSGSPARERFLERARELVLGLDGEPDGSVGLCEARVVRDVLREVDLGEPLLEEHVLPLPDHPEVPVVDDHDHDREILEHGGGELLPVIWKQPSPSTHTTVASGRAAFAPIAAGTP